MQNLTSFFTSRNKPDLASPDEIKAGEVSRGALSLKGSRETSVSKIIMGIYAESRTIGSMCDPLEVRTN
jgi:hypothetical protein